jgi:hypothetical protein
MIVSAAIKITGLGITGLDSLICSLPRPARHINIKMSCEALGVIMHTTWPESGFLDHEGNFLTRLEASQHVLDIGQPLLCSSINKSLGLFTEDLW